MFKHKSMNYEEKIQKQSCLLNTQHINKNVFYSSYICFKKKNLETDNE